MRVNVAPVEPGWLNGFMAAGFHSGLISLSDLKLEYMKAHRNAYGERMTEAQEQQFVVGEAFGSYFRL